MMQKWTHLIQIQQRQHQLHFLKVQLRGQGPKSTNKCSMGWSKHNSGSFLKNQAGAGLSKVDAKKALEAGVEAIKAALVAGDKVQLVGFGTFAINQKPAREGINPATKQKIKIAAKKVAKFKAGQEFAEAINK